MNTDSQSQFQPTILCVDDDAHVLKALQRVLQRYGCRVLLASNGNDAIRKLDQEQVEVLICDEAMPGMRGIEVLRQAKAISPGTARVLLTAHYTDGDVIIPAINESEVFRLLSKPWEDDEVCQVVADALGLEPQEWSQQKRRMVQQLQGLKKGSESSAARANTGQFE